MQKAGEMHPLTARLQPWRECKQPRTSGVPAALKRAQRNTKSHCWLPHISLTQTTDFSFLLQNIKQTNPQKPQPVLLFKSLKKECNLFHGDLIYVFAATIHAIKYSILKEIEPFVFNTRSFKLNFQQLKHTLKVKCVIGALLQEDQHIGISEDLFLKQLHRHLYIFICTDIFTR